MSIVELDQEALAVDDSGATDFVPVRKSLADMLGREYTDAACRARAFLTDTDVPPLADEVVDFFPQTLQSRLVDLLAQVGNTVLDAPLANTAVGAGSASFAAKERWSGINTKSGRAARDQQCVSVYRCAEIGARPATPTHGVMVIMVREEYG